MQLTLSSVAGRVKKVQCIGRAPQAERGLISMRKSNGRAWGKGAGGERRRDAGESERVAPHRNTTCHVAKLGIRFQARKRRCNECRLQGYRGRVLVNQPGNRPAGERKVGRIYFGIRTNRSGQEYVYAHPLSPTSSSRARPNARARAVSG